ncbi:MAG TPA: N-acetylmuramoyl-L-alanine amidase [Thermomicrobiales bacterium]|nr:N-acetylmuramoyl-L-alanine amidase [Thermomicrobiales bacterium]
MEQRADRAEREGGAATPPGAASGGVAGWPAGEAVTEATPFRAIGDVARAVWEREAARRASPIDDLGACAAASRGFGALALAQAIRETGMGRTGGTERRNALGLMGPDSRTPLRFERWVDGFAAYRRRLADPAYKDGVYAPPALTMADFVAVYVGGPGCRASGLERCANGETRATITAYAHDVARLINGWRADADAPPAAGREPPAIVDRILPPGLNTAWDDLGPRTIRGVCLHRMLGTLTGTDAWVRGGGRAAARTDFGIGDGRIFQWTPLTGRMAPWASGPANDVEGDGVAFVRRYGVAAVNRDLVSIELAGWYDTPVPPADWARLVDLVAWLAAVWLQVDAATWPRNREGVHALYGHYEFAAKPCPGLALLGRVGALIDEVGAKLRA